jgi:hypothetical protein
MRNARDTFLRYLADNLPSLTIHPVRFDKNFPGGELLQGNAVNVEFTNSEFTVIENEQIVHIDICHENELTALDWARQVAELLLTAAYVKKLDYSSGTGVNANDGWISWEPHVRFRAVSDLTYFRFSATLRLTHK